MNKKLGIGVIGLGRLGSSYARYFNGRIDSAHLVAVSDVNESAAAALAAELGVSKRYDRYQDLIADAEVEG
ncbi:MAG: Gfo/Idh/MocA family oxidoreductase, partial [Acidobacteriota bacterium]|nr:Gfo/Idh/MocA family oxidoreductase [Acidobacteriota bacterium]